ncbi:MAG: shikimate dehydrogenase family protein [Candidatus Woesearchaeota archaeon]
MNTFLWFLIGNKEIPQYSIAKELWEKLFQIKNINARFLYLNSDDKDYILKEFNKLINKKNIVGFNIAMPWKNLLYNKCEKIKDEVKNVKTINTIIKKENSLIGLNSDGKALYNLIKKNILIKNKKILILGAGGAIQTLPYFLIPDEISEIFFYDINEEKIEKLQIIYGENKIKKTTRKEISKIIGNFDLILNATPIGMFKKEKESILTRKEISRTKKSIILIECIYNPEITEFLKFGIEQDRKVISGMHMLIEQAVISFETAFDRKVSKNEKKELYEYLK